MPDQKTIRAIMVCAMGMSSSLLENKTREAARAAGVPFELHAITVPEIARWDFKTNPVDIVLVAPQVRYKRKSIAEAGAPHGVVVIDIDPVIFGMVEGEKLFQQVMTALQGRQA